MSKKRSPTRDLDALRITHAPPGAEKGGIRNRAAAVPLSCEYDHLPHVRNVLGKKDEPPEPPPRRGRSGRATLGAKDKRQRPYAELHAASAFSFLDGASLPEDLIAYAAELGLPAMALVDTNGVYGAPRFYGAAKKAGVRALVGAEIVLEESGSGFRVPGSESSIETQPGTWNPELGTPPVRTTDNGQRTTRSQAAKFNATGTRLTLLVENRAGYKNLCKLLTAGALSRTKGAARYDWSMIQQHAAGLRCITGGDEGPVPRALESGGVEAATELLHKIGGIFPGRTYVELQRHHRREQEHRNQALVDLARRFRLPLIATNGVRYAGREDKELHDVLTCIREGTNVDVAGRLLSVNRERHLRGAEEMNELFCDLPEALDGTLKLAAELDFTLADLGYQFPDYPLPAGETPMSFLRKIAWNGATGRFRPLTARAQAQIEKELATIEKLDLAGYFLIVWDIVQFCQREKILVQGRGSAANSAVCYALSITAVDPVKMELLFERFLSEERGEWPDIDLDLPSGDQREKVIQHVYKTYGVHGSAMTANVITYRDRSSAREVAKALGYSLEQADKLSKCVSSWNFGEIREKIESLPAEVAAAGFDPEDRRVRHLIRNFLDIQNLPRHLGQHSGGMVMARGRLDEVVPLEPASMPGRVVIQWDKDDCADLGLIKVDLLGLGMLAAIEQAIPLIRNNERIEVDLAHLPQDDPLVYKMLNEADTVGMFQVESRAQMASLPRNAPATFYDIVVQVAIIRPGPIVGGMVKPFFDRRQGKVPVEYPHPCLEPILKRTLGVPLFQEQLLRIAMVAAGFTGGEAEELRRAMGFKRSMERMRDIESRLREGMTERGIGPAAQEQIVKSITSFALYGFPESHAASFALIAYASAYIKAHHPAAFTIALLNAWPMGFYHPATLIKDAQRHGVEVRPIDVNYSGWMCRWEEGAVRMGLRFVKGLREATAKAIESEQARVIPTLSLPKGRNLGAREDRRMQNAECRMVNEEDDAGASSDVILSEEGRAGVSEGSQNAKLPAATPRTDESISPHPALRATLSPNVDSGRGQRHGRGEGESWRPFRDVDDFARRCNVREDQLTKLAWAGALASFGLTRRAALWQAAEAAKPAGELFEDTSLSPSVTETDTEIVIRGEGRGEGQAKPMVKGASRKNSWKRQRATPPPDPSLSLGMTNSIPPLPASLSLEMTPAPSPLPEMTSGEETLADYDSMQLTTGPHLVEHFRAQLKRDNVIAALDLKKIPNGRRVATAGAVIVRQRPGTAKGFVFLTLEDETGMSQAIVSPTLFRENRSLIVTSPGLIVEGILQNTEGQASIKAERFWRLDGLGEIASHDFH
jgi:error-prone DNA polymerase